MGAVQAERLTVSGGFDEDPNYDSELPVVIGIDHDVEITAKDLRQAVGLLCHGTVDFEEKNKLLDGLVAEIIKHQDSSSAADLLTAKVNILSSGQVSILVEIILQVQDAKAALKIRQLVKEGNLVISDEQKNALSPLIYTALVEDILNKKDSIKAAKVLELSNALKSLTPQQINALRALTVQPAND